MSSNEIVILPSMALFSIDFYLLWQRLQHPVSKKEPRSSFDPIDPYTPKKVIKGGSFLCNPSYCESFRPSARRGGAIDTGTSHIGFRLVKDAE